jgi:hypothetical protein
MDIPSTLVLKRHTLDYPDNRLDLPHGQATWCRTGSHRGCEPWRRRPNIGTGQRIISNWRVTRLMQTCVWRTSRWLSFGLNAHTRLNSRGHQPSARSCKRVAVARRRAASDCRADIKKCGPSFEPGPVSSRSFTAKVPREADCLAARAASSASLPRACTHKFAVSALPPKADIGRHDRDVRFVPIADIGLVSSPSEKPRRHAGIFYLRG